MTVYVPESGITGNKIIVVEDKLDILPSNMKKKYFLRDTNAEGVPHH